MVITNLINSTNSFLPWKNKETTDNRNFSYLLRAAVYQEPLRIDATGNFYMLRKPQGILSPLIRLINSLTKFMKEGFSSAHQNQDTEISEKALTVLNTKRVSFENILEQIPRWNLKKNDQKQLADLEKKKNELKAKYEEKLQSIRENLDRQLQKKLKELDQMSTGITTTCKKKIKQRVANIKKLIALKKAKERRPSENYSLDLHNLFPDNRKKVEDYSVSELRTLIDELLEELKIYQLNQKNTLKKLDDKKQDLQNQSDELYKNRVESLENKYYSLMENLLRKERMLIEKSRESFKKDHNIDGTKRELDSFQIQLSAISQLHLNQDVQHTFQTCITKIQDQAHYLHTMAEKAIDTNIVVRTPPSKRHIEEDPRKELKQVENRLLKIKEELSSSRLLSPQESKERALSFTSEVKDLIGVLNHLQKENPRLKKAITRLRQFILTQIAPTPKVHLEFHEIYSAA